MHARGWIGGTYKRCAQQEAPFNFTENVWAPECTGGGEERAGLQPAGGEAGQNPEGHPQSLRRVGRVCLLRPWRWGQGWPVQAPHPQAGEPVSVCVC